MTLWLYLLNLLFSHTLAQELAIKNLTTEDGLPSNMVFSVIQTNDKFIWFSTEIGVCRFDGKIFKKLDFNEYISENIILETKETKDGRKWFLPLRGPLSYLKSDSIHVVNTKSYTSKALISELLETPKGRIAVSYFGDGIRIFENGIEHHITSKEGLSDNYISYIWNEKEVIYCISKDGIYKIGKGYKAVLLTKFNKSSHFSRACRTKSNAIIFSAKDKIFRFTEREGITEVSNSESVITQNINQLISFGDDEFAACTNNGIHFFTIRNNVIKTKKILFKNTPTTDLIIDHEQNYWVTTLDKGVIIYRESEFRNIGNKTNAYSFYNWKNNLFIGYKEYTFATLKGDSISYIYLSSKNKNTQQKIKSVFVDDNCAWLLLDGGLASYKDGKTNYYRTPTGAMLLKNDTFCFGGGNGYFKIPNKFVTDSLCINDAKPSVSVPDKFKKLDERTLVIKSFMNKFYVGTDNGLYIDTGSVFKNSHRILSHAKVSDIFIANDTVIVATRDDGIFLITAKDTIQYNTNTGLISNYCTSVYYRAGDIFVGTNLGFTILYNVMKERQKTESYTSADGLPNENIHDICMYNNKILLATDNGVHVFEKSTAPVVKFEIPLYLERLRVNDSVVNPQKREFAYYESKFEFQFTPITFRYSDRIKTYYKFEGSITSDWLEFEGNQLLFASLGTGKYLLSVKTSINNQDSDIFRFDFEVLPPFWKTWWFNVTILIGLILLIYVFFRIRILTYNRDVVRELIIILINKFKKDDFVVVKNVKDGSHCKIILNELQFIESSNNYIEFNLGSGERILVRMTLKEVLLLINNFKNKKFVQCHKSYIVNTSRISAIKNDFVKIKEHKIPIGKQYAPALYSKVQFK